MSPTFLTMADFRQPWCPTSPGHYDTKAGELFEMLRPLSAKATWIAESSRKRWGEGGNNGCPQWGRIQVPLRMWNWHQPAFPLAKRQLFAHYSSQGDVTHGEYCLKLLGRDSPCWLVLRSAGRTRWKQPSSPRLCLLQALRPRRHLSCRPGSFSSTAASRGHASPDRN